MSIIEKAAGRISSDRKGAAPRTESAPPISMASIASTAVASSEVRASALHEASERPARASRRQEIDLVRLRQAGMVTPNAERTAVAEEFRFIKRPLISTAFQNGAPVNHGNLIMVTSALPGEGKTFCAINLAMSIAMEMDHTVLLVDADVARPSVLSSLGLEAKAGLMDLLQDKSLDMADLMIKTNVETLSVLPAGSSHKNATELLASQSMQALLSQIANRYPDRIVIFDSPPLLLTSEARVLAAQMGQIVVVVEAQTTTQNALKDALRKIETCANVNLVYNKGRAFADRQDYSYYHG